ncbi:hypothetical protein MUB24_16525 [Lederbergia sp. NSJ-179]|uniref:hypothetical protein n=1 Tax=Lederbergia sp. NSJ-179 TaxID=2931402 RepID=UPI001FD0102A|nr:hypothetical protein [Lederbergia sp. NSJ-179]MCJ7842475.1 hypothetical protein [Lederbergia sp. NSJ-179]
MNFIVRWFPGSFVMTGGLFTIYHFIMMIKETEEAHAQQSGPLLVALTGFTLLLSGSLIVPLFFGAIVALIGFIMLWKTNLALSFSTLILSLVLLNWIGFFLSFSGSLVGLICWGRNGNKRLKE